MKKIFNYLLLGTILGTFLPYSALAQTTNLGVNITGSPVIDVVTTISANITLDLTTGETTPTYMEIKNNSSVPVSAKITNISTTSEGAPSTFVGASDKNWNTLSKEETSTYVNFNILGEGQNVTAEDILKNTEVDLGVMDSKSFLGYDCPDTGICLLGYNSDGKIFEINANFGKNWDNGDKIFTYQITTLYSRADEYVETTYTYPNIENLPNIKNMALMSVVTYEELSNYTFLTSKPENNHFDYYYLFAIDMNEGMGSATAIESGMVLWHQYSRQVNSGAYNLILNDKISEGIFQNYVVVFDEGCFGLLVPSDIKNSELKSGANYKTIDIEMLQPINSGETTYTKNYFDNYHTIYNYTYIIRIVKN